MFPFRFWQSQYIHCDLYSMIVACSCCGYACNNAPSVHEKSNFSHFHSCCCGYIFHSLCNGVHVTFSNWHEYCISRSCSIPSMKYASKSVEENSFMGMDSIRPTMKKKTTKMCNRDTDTEILDGIHECGCVCVLIHMYYDYLTEK